MLLEKMPSVQLTNMDGEEFSTDRLRGKKALIFMWASW
ncbi:TlpA family protein disulfide reductase [Pseudalkalibacillus sp. R45]